MRLKINKMEHFHYRNIGQIGHFFMNFHHARYEKVKKSVPPNIKNEASDHLNEIKQLTVTSWYFVKNESYIQHKMTKTR